MHTACAMIEKLDSGNPQPLFSPFPAASQPGGMLYVGTIPSEKYIPDASLGITSDGFFDLEEQPKRVAVVRPVELAGVFNQPPLHKPGVWRIFPAAIPLLSPRVEQVLGAIFYIFKPCHRPTGTDQRNSKSSPARELTPLTLT
ncbi:hypothetical protein GG344DRAFT_83920 [Lentinula edodes]|nr:hypothetical protein GG344DRAFT_83920 [Lentinula edodes]